MTSRFAYRSALSQSAFVRVLGVAALLGGLWFAVAWAVAIP